MDSVLPVEQPFWFSITMGADVRLAPVLRDLSARIARQVGCVDEDADRFGTTLVKAVSQAIEHGHPAGEGTRIEAVFRVGLSAFEVTLLLKGGSDRGVAALAALEPTAVWPVEVLKCITDRFEISRDPQGSRCRVTRPLAARAAN
jgi:anti-sigma regulatory factor (Ser/Thr protein kinase)